MKKHKCDCGHHHHHHGDRDNGSWMYFLGVIGALIYFLGKSTSFTTGVVAILKSFVWPTFLVLEALKLLNL